MDSALAVNTCNFYVNRIALFLTITIAVTVLGAIQQGGDSIFNNIDWSLVPL